MPRMRWAMPDSLSGLAMCTEVVRHGDFGMEAKFEEPNGRRLWAYFSGTRNRGIVQGQEYDIENVYIYATEWRVDTP